jgi:hypothetical protein
MNKLINIRIYNTVSSYCVDVWQGLEVINELEVNIKSDDIIGQIREFVNQYDMYKLKDEMGIMK